MMQKMKTRNWVAGAGAVLALALGTAWASEQGGQGDASQSSGHSGPAHWGYSGAEGPENWASLTDDYALCGTGHTQSPINITRPESADLAPLRLDYDTVPLDIVNNGHTVQVNVPPGNALRVGDRRFELLQFHFHTPSEHVLNGTAKPMEVHFVHKAADGELAVIGVFFDVGMANGFLASFNDTLPRQAKAKHRDGTRRIDLRSLFPADMTYVRYFGSLTTPPCSEGVNWYVVQSPVGATRGQLSAFKGIMGENARPAREATDRYVLISG